MNKNTGIVIGLIVVILAGIFAVYYYMYTSRNSEMTGTRIELTQEQKENLVREHIRVNISALSPEPEQLGGTFRPSEFTFFGDDAGTVLYEDGHNLFLGRFTYMVDESGAVVITSFTAEKNPNFDAKG